MATKTNKKNKVKPAKSMKENRMKAWRDKKAKDPIFLMNKKKGNKVWLISLNATYALIYIVP